MPWQDHGRLLSACAVIKDPLGTTIDHAVVLLQGDDKRSDPFGATSLVGGGCSDPMREYPFATSGTGITKCAGDLNAVKLVG